MESVNYWIEKLELSPHPEGGWFRETYRSAEMLPEKALAGKYTANHSLSTAIYYLLSGDLVSKFHRLRADETWHHYYGSALNIYTIDTSGRFRESKLGKEITTREYPQLTIPGGNWLAAGLSDKKTFALVGCTVSPSFEYEEFELGKREALIKKYPEHKQIIEIFT